MKLGYLNAIIVFDENLLISWDYNFIKTKTYREKIPQKITGFTLSKGKKSIKFTTNDLSIVYFKEIIKQKVRFSNFYDEYILIKTIGRGSFSKVFFQKVLKKVFKGISC